ncbi:MAG: hypothetical protein AAF600_17395 [Bacteroidota bacterium]
MEVVAEPFNLPIGPGGSIKSIRVVLSAWRNVNFKSVASTIRYHLGKHGQGKSVFQYTDDALDLFKNFR